MPHLSPNPVSRPVSEIVPALREWVGDTAEFHTMRYHESVPVSWDGDITDDEGEQFGTVPWPEKVRGGTYIDVVRPDGRNVYMKVSDLRAFAPYIGNNGPSVIYADGDKFVLTTTPSVAGMGGGHMFAHDLAHIIVAPFDDLIKPNLGLSNGIDSCGLPEGHPLIVQEEQVFIATEILFRHLGFRLWDQNALRLARTILKIRIDVVLAGIEAGDYDKVRADWDARVAYMREHGGTVVGG
ncbi:MAG: hypothetical protein AB7L09_01985 [Nitrospira sp.]